MPDSHRDRNRSAWETANEKYVREYQDLLTRARNESSLFPHELDLLRPILAHSPAVVHLQSGHGLDDIALVDAGARSVVGVDFSQVTASAAQRRDAYALIARRRHLGPDARCCNRDATT